MPPYQDTMYPESDFYQISGYRAHSNAWCKDYDEKPMITNITAMKSKLFRPGGPDAPLELILGIRPGGESYLLMTSEQMLEFTHKHYLPIQRNRKPWQAADFRSLSPIYFTSRDQLAAKIATYKQRPRNKNRRDSEEPQDNSQANRGYVKTGSGVVHYRAYFEQQRTLYRLFTKDLEPCKVGMALPPWLDCVRVVSLVFGEWSVEDRPRAARLNDPRLADIGWTDTSFPSFFEQLTGSTVHFKLKNLRNASAKDAYFSEVVEGDLETSHSRLRTLLSHDTNKTGIPLIVLVHDEDMARSVLSRAGIDVDTWSSGLSDLLPLAPVKSRHRPEGNTFRPPALPGPSIVDTQKLIRAVMETTNPGQTLPQSARVLHMQTDTRTCAGDDSLLQLHMWTSMAEGLAIDEQRKQRLAQEPACAQVLAPPRQERAHVATDPAADPEADPEEMDPNDMPPAPRPTIADDFSDEDDW